MTLPFPSPKQVSLAAGEWTDCGVHSGTVFQAEIQPAAQVSPSTLPASWPGTEAHLLALRGETGKEWLGWRKGLVLNPDWQWSVFPLVICHSHFKFRKFDVLGKYKVVL